jgi:hypothetical protein
MSAENRVGIVTYTLGKIPPPYAAYTGPPGVSGLLRGAEPLPKQVWTRVYRGIGVWQS